MKILLSKLSPHPLNRHFDRCGEKWEQFVASVREHGVFMNPMVRPQGDGYQIVFGHRRTAAAEEAGEVELDCEVREIDDRTALELLVIENLERENPDPVEEGKLLCALEKEGVDVTILAHRLKRSVDWITTRQRLLDLGEEVIEAVRLPRESGGHLDMGTVKVILSVPESDRARAIQLVLHPEWTTEVLGQREAESVIKSVILEPARKKAAWEKESPGLVKAWKKALAAFLTKEEKKDLIVQALRYDEWETCKLKTAAEDLISNDRLPYDEKLIQASRRWVHLAIFHGLPVWVIPGDGTTDSEMARAVVDERLIVLAETARAENGLPATLLTGKAAKPKIAGFTAPAPAVSTPAEEEDGEQRERRIADALSEMEGGGDPNYQEEESPETVIKQHMESSAWVDLGPVRSIREWVVTALEPRGHDLALPDWLPEWVGMQEGMRLETMLKACDWFLGLKK